MVRGMARVRVLVVDDSAVVRRQVTQMLESDPGVEVVATAPDGRLALERIAQHAPDVVLLDLEMPGMDGLATLRALRQRAPRLPVLLFSSLTERAGALTLDALALGANDYLTKPSTLSGERTSLASTQAELISRVKALHAMASGVPLPVHGEPAAPAEYRPAAPPRRRTAQRVEVVVVGTSTGGPNALVEVVAALPAHFPVPVLIVQHMPPMFTRLLAERLNGLSPLEVREAQGGELPRPGEVWIAPGGLHLAVTSAEGEARLVTHRGAPENSCRPAVDVLFRAAAEVWGAGVLAVVMTGMGQDGLKGCRRVREAGGQVVVQEPTTCVIGSMPLAVMQAGLADRVVPLAELGLEVVRRAARPRPGGAPPWS